MDSNGRRMDADSLGDLLLQRDQKLALGTKLALRPSTSQKALGRLWSPQAFPTHNLAIVSPTLYRRTRGRVLSAPVALAGARAARQRALRGSTEERSGSARGRKSRPNEMVGVNFLGRSCNMTVTLDY